MSLPDREPDDATLIRAFLTRGDRSAFDRLYRRHSPSLLRVALAATAGDRDQAEDLLHEVWMVALDRLDRFAGRSALRTWLTGILLHRVRRLRRLRSSHHLDLGGADLPGVTPPEPVDRIALEQALTALPPRARLVLILHDAEGYTHEDIAALLAIEVGTSKSQLFRARRALARMLGPAEEDGP